MTYYPAPGAQTRLVLPDGSKLSGDVSVSPSNGIAINRLGNGLVVVGAASKRARSVELFIPGVLAARNVLVEYGIPNGILQAIDAYFKTAPGAGTDINNYASLHLTGAGGHVGPVDFALNVNGQAEWHLGGDALSQVLGWFGITAASGGSGIAHKVCAHGFHPTANMTVGGLAWQAQLAGSICGQVNPTRIGLAARIGAADGITADTVPWLTGLDGISKAYVDVQPGEILPYPAFSWLTLPSPVALVNGGLYSAVFINQDVIDQLATLTTGTGGVSGNVVGDSTVCDRVGYPGPFTGVTPFDSAAFGFFPEYKLLGSVVGTPLNGPITTAVQIIGAPANPGADLLVSLQF